MLRMEKVTKTYQLRRQTVVALDNATLEIPAGDFVSVVGPSGSGKSTLLLMLGGMLSPTSGRVTFHGESMYDMSTDARARLRKSNIGFVFQTFNLVPYLSTLENVEVPLYLAGVYPTDQKDILDVPQPRVSRHLGHLKKAGLVVARKSGLWIHYSLAPATSTFHRKLLECAVSCFQEVPEIRADVAKAAKLKKSGGCCPRR
jgi:ABC-type sugar transport system ATPase subunit